MIQDIVFKLPSLQHIVFVKISTELWNRRDIWSGIADVLLGNLHAIPSRQRLEKTDVENQVIEKVSALPLCESLQKLSLHFIKCIGMEIYRWLEDHRVGDEILFEKHFPERLHWTARGSIDYKTTAELLVKDENLSLRTRHQIACINCLEEDVRRLIKLSPENINQAVIDDYKGGNTSNQRLMLFWARTINGTVGVEPTFVRVGNFSLYQNAYTDSLNYSSVTASEYFFEKLSQPQKNEVLVDVNCYPRGNLNSIVFYLSRVSERQQQRYFQSCVPDVLRLLLKWPWHALFIETAKRLWRFMNYKKGREIASGCGHFRYYSELFLEFYLLSPSQFKKYLLGTNFFITELFLSKEDELFTLIANEANKLQKKRLYSVQFNEIPHILMDESLVSKKTLIKCRRNVELDWKTVENEQGSFSKGEKLLRFIILDCIVKLNNIQE